MPSENDQHPALGGLPVVLGGNVFGWTADLQESFRILDGFVDAGGCMIDTADVYSAWVSGHKGGESEKIIGQWLKSSGKRDKVRIATKVGMLPGEGGKGLAPERIAAACDASLTRLGIDLIDVYYAHQDDFDVAQEDVAEAFGKLLDAGKIASLGASNFTPERLASALDIGTPYTVLQPEYNLLARGSFETRLAARRGSMTPYEGALRDLCMARDIAVLPYFGLASGFLTGKYRQQSDIAGSRAARIADYYCDEGMAVLAAMDEVAAETGATLTRIALAWLIAQPGITAPIASVSKREQLDDVVAAAGLRLSGDQLARLSWAAG
ncbi:aldo/keto reductase [Altererythrobacter confluentis]|uniref:Aldo/keto reductase n=1 Tax=Allopontixanthobacter confluentis TaxID=1849021 RepID=A0A6L7GFL2_9SPHN|nr:aldo/keto reductase [Allopontixanthobacter confluentis]MXP14667.1 aldo/keto reductase [Allopontixanthobacter confluentis]